MIDLLNKYIKPFTNSNDYVVTANFADSCGEGMNLATTLF